MRNDASGVVSALAASPNNVLTRRQAADHGLDHRRIARLIGSGILHEPWPGVLIGTAPGAQPTWLQLQAAATLRDAAASHRAAARLAALDGLVLDPTLEIAQCGAHRRLAGVVTHRVRQLDPCDLVTVLGIRTTNIARTLCDLGAVRPAPVVERAFDDAVRRGAHPRWLRSTAERLHRPGQAGPAMILRLLDRHESRGTVRDSWFERLVEMCLRHPELDDLVIQHALRDAAGRTVARFDLAVPSAQLGIEGHSRRHHFGAAGEASDEHRDNAAGRLGWDVMYIGYGDVRSPSTVLDEVLARVRIRRAQFGVCT